MRKPYIPPRFRGTYEKAMSGRSQKTAIKAYCLRCCSWQPKEIRSCTCLGCPLFAFRLGRAQPLPEVPEDRKYTDGIGRHREGYEKALRGKSRRAAIRAACLLCSAWNSASVRCCHDKGCPLWLYRLTGAKVPIRQDATSQGESPSPGPLPGAIGAGRYSHLGEDGPKAEIITGEGHPDEALHPKTADPPGG